MEALAICLAALYLRGAPRAVEVRRAHWPEVLRVLRRAACKADEAAEALRDSGQWVEALALESPDLLSWAESQVDSGRALTCVDAEYPCRWLRVLGCSAPPALWKLGPMPSLPAIGIVGSRVIPAGIARFCAEVAVEAHSLGFAVVSGGAEGCDRAAAHGARRVGGAVVEILPAGLGLARPRSAGCFLSVCAPGEPFTSASAMERNALIYAAGSHTIVGQARFKEGGTWQGAIRAIRSRLSTIVLRRSSDLAMRSLASLGGIWLDSPSGLRSALKATAAQEALFGTAG